MPWQDRERPVHRHLQRLWRFSEITAGRAHALATLCLSVEAIAVMDRTLSFDPLEAENLGFEVHSRVMIPFLQTSGALDEEHTAVGS